MRTPYLTRGTALFCIGALLSIALASAQAEPILPPPNLPTPPLTPPTTAPQTPNTTDKIPKKVLRVLTNATLDYSGASNKSVDVLNAKVSVTFKNTSFLAALDMVMSASPKTCRIECRQVRPMRLSMGVQDVPVAGLLDALAKLGGAHLFVLPSKIIISPENALSEEEKRDAQPYGLLLTATTLPKDLNAHNLAKSDGKRPSILDTLNTKISGEIENDTLDHVLGSVLSMADSQYATLAIYFGKKSDLEEHSVNLSLEGVALGDILSSLAYTHGCELYVTGDKFIICPPEKLAAQNLQGAVPPFLPNSMNFTTPSAKNS